MSRRKNKRRQAQPRWDWRRVPWRPLAWLAEATVLLGLVLGLGYAVLSQHRPVTHVRIEGELEQLSQPALRQAVVPDLRKGWREMDLGAMREAVVALPWVASAELRRVWPDTLVIRVHGRVPVARWGELGLLGRDGTPFRPRHPERYAQLPRLDGPAGSERQAWREYQQLARPLEGIGLRPVGMDLDSRGACTLHLTDGLEILLGRENKQARLARLVRVYRAAIAAQQARVARIDLRYGNGFAVEWRDGAEHVAERHSAAPGGHQIRSS